jgi:hypothetical protein
MFIGIDGVGLESGWRRVAPNKQQHFVRQPPDGKAWMTTHGRRTPLDGVLAQWNSSAPGR